mgnify:CR=1 FL=1
MAGPLDIQSLQKNQKIIQKQLQDLNNSLKQRDKSLMQNYNELFLLSSSLLQDISGKLESYAKSMSDLAKGKIVIPSKGSEESTGSESPKSSTTKSSKKSSQIVSLERMDEVLKALEDIQNTIVKTSSISTSMSLASMGYADQIPNIKAFSQSSFEKILQRFNSAYTKLWTGNKDVEKEEESKSKKDKSKVSPSSGDINIDKLIETLQLLAKTDPDKLEKSWNVIEEMAQSEIAKLLVNFYDSISKVEVSEKKREAVKSIVESLDIFNKFQEIGNISLLKINKVILSLTLASELKPGKYLEQLFENLIFKLPNVDDQVRELEIEKSSGKSDFALVWNKKMEILKNIFEDIEGLQGLSFDTTKKLIKTSALSKINNKLFTYIVNSFGANLRSIVNSFKKIEDEDIKKFTKNFEPISTSLIKSIEKLSTIGKSKIETAYENLKLFGSLSTKFGQLIKKFEKYPVTKEDKLKTVKIFTDSVKLMIETTEELIKISGKIPLAMKNFDFLVSNFIKMINKLKKQKTDIKGQFKGIKEFTNSLKGLASGVIMLALVTPLVPLAATSLLLIGGVIKLLSLIGKKDRTLRKSLKAISSIGVGILAFGASALLFSLIMEKVGGSFVKGLLMLTATSGLFLLLGKFDDSIKKGARAVTLMGIGLMAFATGTALMALVMMAAKPENILFGLVTLAGTGLVFGLLGKFLKDIALGSLAAITMGIGLFAFSLGLIPMTEVLKDYTFEKLGLHLATIAGIGTVMTLLGVAVTGLMGAPIIGAAAAALMGLSLIPLSAGLKEISNVKPLSAEQTVDLGLMLGALTVGFSAMGLASPLLIPGTAVGILMGKALSNITSGLKSASRFDWKSFPIDNVKGVIIGLSEAFAVVASDGKTGVSGLLGGVLNVIGLTKNKVKVGIESVLGSAKALTDVAEGIKTFSQLTKYVDLSGTKTKDGWIPKPGSIGEKISISLSILNKVFSDIGSSGNTNASLIGLIFGTDMKQSNTEVGIKSVLKAGKALKSVATGLNIFDSMTKDVDLSGVQKDGKWLPKPDSLGEKISISLSILNKVFSDIGASGNTNKSLVGLIFGSDLKQSDTEIGIKSVLKAGKALKSVASGLKSFDSMTKDVNLSGVKEGDSWIPSKDSLGERITISLSLINKIFSDIGASGNTNKSLVGLIFGSDLKQSDTKIGIESVLQAGEALINIAKGINKFEYLTENLTWEGPDSTPERIAKTLTMINKVFGAIGKSDNDPTLLKLITGTDFGESDVKKGIDSVKNVGKVLEDTAKGLKEWTKLSDKGIDLKTISKNVMSVITTISSSFKEIGDSGEAVEPSFFDSIFGGGDVKEDLIRGNPVARGITSVKGMGKILLNIAGAISKFAKL